MSNVVIIAAAENIDATLLTVSWCSTGVFVLLLALFNARWRRRKTLAAKVNGLLVAVVLFAFGLLAFLTRTSFTQVPELLWNRLFDGTYERLCLLLFWLLCAVCSLLFAAIIQHNSANRRAHTSHRKFFHLTGSLVTVTGLFHDPALLTLCVSLVLQIFIILEALRSHRILPWCTFLDEWLLMFIDGQDSVELILTPILLLAGLNLPFLFDFSFGTRWQLHQRHFAGVLSVGVGDSFAALVGSRYGKVFWPSPSAAVRPKKIGHKSMEGSLAMFVTQIVAVELLFGFCSLNTALVISALGATLAEAFVYKFDNLAVPACSFLIFWLLE